MNSWRRRISELRWGLVWLASSGICCWALLAETAEEGVYRRLPTIIAPQNHWQPSGAYSSEGNSDVPEAPWTPPSETPPRAPSESPWIPPPACRWIPPTTGPAHLTVSRGGTSESDAAKAPAAVLAQDVWTPVWEATPAWQQPVCQQAASGQPAWGPQRPASFERIARQADQHIQRGFDLAGRRAYFSARAEFLSAVRLIAEGLDQHHRTQRHSQALDRGLTALEEADDFLALRNAGGENVDLRAIAAGHSTPVLQGERVETLTAMEALQRYLTYAQEQLAAACGQEPVGSLALHGLGKLYAAMGNQSALGVKAAPSKAMAFYQAALLVDPYNFMAANDLGVLLAQGGWYEEARAALSHSLTICNHPVGWRNLAIVYRQMGQYDLALAAARQWRRLRQQEQTPAQEALSAEVVVQWTPPERFAAGPSEGLTAPTGRPDVSPGRLENGNSRPQGSASAPGKQGDFLSRSARPEKPSSATPTENKPGPILSSLLRGPLSVFRQEPPGDAAGETSDGKTSVSSGRAPASGANRPDRSASDKGTFR